MSIGYGNFVRPLLPKLEPRHANGSIALFAVVIGAVEMPSPYEDCSPAMACAHVVSRHSHSQPPSVYNRGAGGILRGGFLGRRSSARKVPMDVFERGFDR